MVIAPLLGMWLSSSLAAYRNSSLLVSLAVGLLLFPVVPLAWEAFSQWRRGRAQESKPSVLTWLDRLVLRTLVLNVLFITITVWSAPSTSFRALATRGDWMLEGRADSTSSAIRSHLFTVADILEGFYGRAESNHYGTTDALESDEDAPEPTDVVGEIDPTKDEPQLVVGDTSYPAKATPHPIVATIPDDKKTSYGQAARYIGENESDPFERVKALHDFVVDRLTYDYATFDAIEAGRLAGLPSQEASDVFAARTSVCEGYAKLLSKMGVEIGISIVYLTGRGGRDGWEVDGVNHAWNAAKILGKWYLIDATWNDGRDNYGTEYLFTPPELFRLDHLPAEDQWQLHPNKISVSQFMRQPMISAGFMLLGLEMRDPKRAQVTVGSDLQIRLHNPRRAALLAQVRDKAGNNDFDCQVTGDVESILSCEFPKHGRYTVEIFGKSGGPSGSYPHIAKLFVNSK